MNLANVQSLVGTITNQMLFNVLRSRRAVFANIINFTTFAIIFFCFHRSGCWFFCLLCNFLILLNFLLQVMRFNSDGLFHVLSLERSRLPWFLRGFFLVNVQTLHDLIGVSSVSCFKQHVYVDSELNGVTSWSWSEVVLSSLQSLAPTVEMHQWHLVKCGVFLVQVQTLRLADIWSSGNGKVHHLLLTDLPHSLVDLFNVIGDFFDVLNTAIVGDDLVFDGGVPKIQLD